MITMRHKSTGEVFYLDEEEVKQFKRSKLKKVAVYKKLKAKHDYLSLREYKPDTQEILE